MARKKLVNQAIRQECIWSSEKHTIYHKDENHGMFSHTTIVLDKPNPLYHDSDKIIYIRQNSKTIDNITVKSIIKTNDIVEIIATTNNSIYTIRYSCTAKKLQCLVTGNMFTMKLDKDNIKHIIPLYKLIQCVVKAYKEKAV